MSETKAKWTPGPWWTDAVYCEEDLGCSIIAANPDYGPMPGNPTRGQVAFATAILPEDAATAQANAHLIAAAPATAEALEKALTQMRVWVSINGDMVGALQEVIDEGEAALALAKGETK
jgi:hypothetical protein